MEACFPSLEIFEFVKEACVRDCQYTHTSGQQKRAETVSECIEKTAPLDVAKINFSHNDNIYKPDLGAIHMPVIPACGKLRQEAKESEGRLGDTAQLFFLTKGNNNKTNLKKREREREELK